LRIGDRCVKEANTWPGGVDVDDVAPTVGRRRARQRSSAVLRGRAAEAPSKCASKDLVAVETLGGGDPEGGRIAAREPCRGAFEAEPERVLFWRLADRSTEGPVKVERRPPGSRGHRLERRVVTETTPQIAEHVEQIAFGRHRRG
jgi:hypothetical protein